MRVRGKTGCAAAAGVALAVGIGWPVVRWAWRPSPPPLSAEAQAHAQSVRILRDRFGVPHIFGRTDADAAFGLAWAHAEDDFPMIEGVMAASRGQLGRLRPGKLALANDYFARFVDVEGELAATWPDLDPRLQAVFAGYAEGLNAWAAAHPDEVNARLLPFQAEDVGRGFIHKLPLMLGVDQALKILGDGVDRPVGEPVFPGSNAHAIAPWRSADGVSRLNVNSHQPWEGPVSWYEATVRSEEGWDAAGATFPGAPMILHGHNAQVGWALTVNRFDAVDVYALEVEGDRYRWDGGWAELTKQRVHLPFDTPWGTLPLPQTVRRSAHGPVFERGARPYAVRHVATGHGLAAAEAWFAMNKAGSGAELEQALARLAIPMFNVVWADAGGVGFVYNGRIPDRTPGFDYAAILPGDAPAAVWTDVLPYAALPRVVDPASGFVQACNSAPELATLGPEAPDPASFPPDAGIESTRTHRALRTLELLADGAPVSREQFLALKWDRGMAAEGALRTRLLDPLPAWTPPDAATAALKQALLDWDGQWEEDSVGAGVALLVWRPLALGRVDVEPGWTLEGAMTAARDHLATHFGGRLVPLGALQRLRRGAVDLPLGGGPDVLNCTNVRPEGPVFVGEQGDSYVMVVEFHPDGPRAESVNVYGASSRPGSPHYADQAPLFVARELKPVLRTEAQLRAFLEAEYRPGEPWTPEAPTDPFQRLQEARAVAGPPPGAP